MNMRIQQFGGVSKIELEGRLDADGVDAVGADFSAHCDSTPNVIVDLGKVPYMASIGIRLLVVGAKAQAGIGGKMVLVGPNELLRRILKTTGIDALMPVYDRVADAAAAFDTSSELPASGT
ncbi:MAG: STAS domain-containing protein [Burkholderiaceae bacterium]